MHRLTVERDVSDFKDLGAKMLRLLPMVMIVMILKILNL